MTAPTVTDPTAHRHLAARMIQFLESGTPPTGLFAPDVFCDFTMPMWRLQAMGAEDVVALRRRGHPVPGRVPRSRLDAIPTGFVLEFEEVWEADGDSWYSREILRADIVDGAVGALTVYCTGDWDSALVQRHAATVELLRP